ncbi:MAG: hypothetical protein LLG37_06160 [Spirochaetia bacterium]|nr:hypothetical protein [Spirochaetia bacterium]
MAEQVKEGEGFDKVFEGIDPALKESVRQAIEFFGKEKSENGNKIEDVVKVNKLRNAYNSLVTTIINEKLNSLNKFQELFLCTGAIGDTVDCGGNKVVLMDPAVYAKLFEEFWNFPEEDSISDKIFWVTKKMKAIAEGKLELIDTSGKKKSKKADEKIDPKKLKAALEWKKNDALKIASNMIRTLGSYLDKIIQIDAVKLKNLKLNYDGLNTYMNILNKGAKLTPEEKKMKDALAARTDMMAKVLADMTKLYAEAFTRSAETIDQLKEKIDEVKQKEIEISKAATAVMVEANSAVDNFTAEHTDLLKRDISIINSFMVSAAEKSSNRVPYSGARILLNSQIPDLERANDSYFCTPKNVADSLKKILSIHTNAFPRDEDGNYMIPPIIIEPIRNYVDFLEDRFIMGFVSGEPGKKGAKVSFSPIDFQVMKAIGMYLAKDPIYDYRGEINEGTFMGDYTGKIEKTAQVKWTGQDKKMNMVISSELVDAASRDDAVANYIDFTFNVLNGLTPPPKMSKRRINILLRYATIYSIENNVKLLLQYVAQSEPIEVRDTIMKFTNRSADAGREMVKKIVKEDAAVQRVLGNNPDMVCAKIFV